MQFLSWSATMAAGSGGVRVDELGRSRGREAARVDTLLPALGLKKRRDSSPGKRFEGDHASLRADPKVLRMLAKYDESRVLFSDFVHKINREGRPKTRVLLIAGKAVYVLNPDTLKCGNRIAAERVSCVTLSTLADNFCHVSPPSLPSHSPLPRTTTKLTAAASRVHALRSCRWTRRTALGTTS